MKTCWETFVTALLCGVGLAMGFDAYASFWKLLDRLAVTAVLGIGV